MDTWTLIYTEAEKLATEYSSKYSDGVAETILSLAAKAVNCKIIVDVAVNVVGEHGKD